MCRKSVILRGVVENEVRQPEMKGPLESAEYHCVGFPRIGNAREYLKEEERKKE